MINMVFEREKPWEDGVEIEDYVKHSRLWERFRNVTINGIPGKALSPKCMMPLVHMIYWEEIGPAMLAVEQYILDNQGDIELDMNDLGKLKPMLDILLKLPERQV